jgi:catechol 2,3-dioxygenase-like lactoylglutathione lyase family enzyme
MRPQPLVCVTDVEASSRWYQRLLGCRGAHGGRQYEQLVKDGRLILQLHSFEVEHHHGPIGDRADRPYGNGVLLWFEVEDFDAVMRRAAEMGVDIAILPMMTTAAPTIGSVGCATRTATPSWSPAPMEPPTAPGAPVLICSPRPRFLSLFIFVQNHQ